MFLNNIQCIVTTPRYPMEGYLQKATYFVVKSPPQWMTIRNGCLIGYNSADDRKRDSDPVDKIDLRSFCAAKAASGPQRFELFGLGQSLFFIAASLAELNEWVRTLNVLLSATSIANAKALCKNAVALSSKQKAGLLTFEKLVASGFEDEALCLKAACKFPRDLPRAKHFVFEALNERATVLKEGFVEKQSRWMGRWRVRYAVLSIADKTCYLATFKEHEYDHPPTELMVITAATEVSVVDADQTVFCVDLKDDAQNFFLFKADSVEQRDHWLSILKSRRNTPWSVLDVLNDL